MCLIGCRLQMQFSHRTISLPIWVIIIWKVECQHLSLPHFIFWMTMSTTTMTTTTKNKKIAQKMPVVSTKKNHSFFIRQTFYLFFSLLKFYRCLSDINRSTFWIHNVLRDSFDFILFSFHVYFFAAAAAAAFFFFWLCWVCSCVLYLTRFGTHAATKFTVHMTFVVKWQQIVQPN